MLLDKRICYILFSEVEVAVVRAEFTAGDLCIQHSVLLKLSKIKICNQPFSLRLKASST